MGTCVPRHIICGSFDTGFTPSSGSSTLPTVGTATKARSQVSGSNAPVAGAVWRSNGVTASFDNNITIEVIWENIRRFNGFAFSNPPPPSTASTSSEYVEIDVKIDVYFSGQLTETFFDDQNGNPLFIQSAEWQSVDTNDDVMADTTVLCWSCSSTGATDTSNIIETIRNHINANSDLITIPSTDVQTDIQVNDGMGGTTTETWDSSYDQDHIGPDNTTILNDGAAIDSAASNNNSYTAATIDLNGASMPDPSGQTGPLFALTLVTNSEVGNNNGSIEQDANDLMYWGQETLIDCYNLTWLFYDSVGDPDCGMPIIGFDQQQNAFIIDDLVDVDVDPGDTITVFGPEIEDATNSTEGPYGSFRATFTVASVNEPGDGTTLISVTQSLPSLYSSYQAVTTVCPGDTCY